MFVTRETLYAHPVLAAAFLNAQMLMRPFGNSILSSVTHLADRWGSRLGTDTRTISTWERINRRDAAGSYSGVADYSVFFLGCDAVSLDERLTDVSEGHSHELSKRREIPVQQHSVISEKT